MPGENVMHSNNDNNDNNAAAGTQAIIKTINESVMWDIANANYGLDAKNAEYVVHLNENGLALPSENATQNDVDGTAKMGSEADKKTDENKETQPSLSDKVRDKIVEEVSGKSFEALEWFVPQFLRFLGVTQLIERTQEIEKKRSENALKAVEALNQYEEESQANVSAISEKVCENNARLPLDDLYGKVDAFYKEARKISARLSVLVKTETEHDGLLDLTEEMEKKLESLAAAVSVFEKFCSLVRVVDDKALKKFLHEKDGLNNFYEILASGYSHLARGFKAVNPDAKSDIKKFEKFAEKFAEKFKDMSSCDDSGMQNFNDDEDVDLEASNTLKNRRTQSFQKLTDPALLRDSKERRNSIVHTSPSGKVELPNNTNSTSFNANVPAEKPQSVEQLLEIFIEACKESRKSCGETFRTMNRRFFLGIEGEKKAEYLQEKRNDQVEKMKLEANQTDNTYNQRYQEELQQGIAKVLSSPINKFVIPGAVFLGFVMVDRLLGVQYAGGKQNSLRELVGSGATATKNFLINQLISPRNYVTVASYFGMHFINRKFAGSAGVKLDVKNGIGVIPPAKSGKTSDSPISPLQR